MAVGSQTRAQRIARTSVVALAAALAAQAAQAQTLSYNAGTPTVASGSVTIDRGQTPGVEVYTVNTPTAVLDFVPTDTATGGGTITFQNANTSVFYRNGPNTANYTVLNRIVPADRSRPILLGGNITSQSRTAAGGLATGGSVWFYTPGGLFVGSTATINVGNLLLTTLDPTGGTGTISSTSRFTGGGSTNAFVNTAAGSTINAVNEGSYVAIVAPSVFLGGNVRVNGQAAYVAAEQATLTINQGLFDIVVDVGTTLGTNAFNHQGSTTGPASTGATDPHAIYMVAVPKNNVLQLFLGGTVGFDAATSASVENGRIILSAGRNVTAGNVSPAVAPASPIAADINFTPNGRFTSNVFGRATRNAFAAPVGGNLTFEQDVTLAATERAHIGARPSQTITVGGSATVFAEGTVVNGPGTTTVTGGEALLYSESGATLRITGAGTAVANASAIGVQNGTSFRATAGRAQIFTSGGTVDVAGSATIQASASGNVVSGPVGVAALLTGGSAGIFSNGGGTIRLAGNASVLADASGTTSTSGGAGVATGGMAQINAGANSVIRIGGQVAVSASGTGNAATLAGTGGRGVAGSANVGGAGVVAVAGNLVMDAVGNGGSAAASTGGDGGDAVGGVARIFTNGAAAALTVGGITRMNTSGIGGTGSEGADTRGGDGQGGPAAGSQATVSNNSINAAQGSITLGAVTVFADGIGGTGITGGNGTAGFGFVGADQGAVRLTGLFDGSFDGVGGDARNSATIGGGAGGNGTGGQFQVFSTAQADTVGSIQTADIVATSIAVGGIGGTGVTFDNGAGGRGGDATSGLISVYSAASGGAVTTGALSFQTNAIGGRGGAGAAGSSQRPAGVGGAGGNATAARIQIGTISSTNLPGNTGSLTTGAYRAESSGIGGIGGAGGVSAAGVQAAGGAGGSGTGGSSGVLVRGTPVRIGTLTVIANGIGGAGGAGSTVGVGGAANAGDASLIVSKRFERTERGSLTITGPSALIANAVGGAGSVRGAESGGRSTISATDADITTGALQVSLSGTAPVNRTAFVVDVANGTLATNGGVLASVSGDTALNVRDGGTFRTGDFSLRTGGSIVPVAVGPDAALGNTGGTPGQIVGTGDFQAFAGGSIALTAGLSATAPGSVIDLRATNNIGVGTVNAGSLLGLIANTGSVSAGTIVSAGSVGIGAARGVTLGSVTTARGGADALYVANTSALVSDPLFAPVLAGGRLDPGVFARATVPAIGENLVATGPISTGLLRVAAVNTTLAGVDAATRVDLIATGLARFTGAVVSPTINIASGDIAIDSTASIGNGSTNAVTLAGLIATGGALNLGGAADSGSGYRLDAAEAARVRAGRISVIATTSSGQSSSSSAQPGITIRTLNLNGSAATNGNLTGSSGTLLIQAPGTIRVEGPVTLANAASSDQFAITSNTRIEVATDLGGQIGISGASTPLSGTLALTAPVIGVATSAILAQLAADPRFAGRDAALALPATVRPEGSLRANRIGLEASNVVAIQNSGTQAIPGGYTSGTGGFGVRATGTSPATDVTVFGRTLLADGTFLTGFQTVRATQFTTATGATFSTSSQLNGCAIGGAACSQQAPIDLTLGGLIDDAGGGAVDAVDAADAASVPSIRIVRLLDDAAVETEPLITDPVAGGGNPGLWDDEEDDDDDDVTLPGRPAVKRGDKK